MPVKHTAATAIDIGHSNLKIVQTTPDGRVARFVVHKIPEGCLDGLNVVYDDALIASLKKAKKNLRHAPGKCTLVLSGSDIIIRHFTLPILPEEELYQNILNEMSGYLPVSPEKYHIDYKIAGVVQEDDIKMYKVLVSTAHRRMIEKFKKVLAKAGLRVNIIDTCENAGEKLLKLGKQQKNCSTDGGVCIADIGTKSTSVRIYHNGNYFVSNSLKRSAQSVTEAIAKSSGKDILAAETIKRETNFLIPNDGPGKKIRSAVVYEVDALLNEISRVLDYYRNRNKTPVKHIYLAGGGALLPGLDVYMQEHLEIAVHHAAALFAGSRNTDNRGFDFLLNAYAATLREEIK